MANDLNIYVQKFYTKAKEKTEGELVLGPDGLPILEDWVAYAPRGQDRLVVREKIERLHRINHRVPKEHPAYKAAAARWDYIRPLYESWKKGEELPVNGTPLAVANFIRAEDADTLKKAGVRTLEELIDLPEHHRDRINVPRVREMVVQAKRFLEMQDRNLALSEVKKRDDEINLLKQQVEALLSASKLKAQTIEIVEEPPAAEEPKTFFEKQMEEMGAPITERAKRLGRPPKPKEEAAE